ncbi:cytochrome p450 [Moniliophthora roreri]|nr:cytochrome p450 [Moniliophthora roreri]
MEGELNQLNEAYSRIFKSGGRYNSRLHLIIGVLQEVWPIFHVTPWRHLHVLLNGIGGKGNNWHAHGLLSLLVRLNVNTNLPEGHRMGDKDVMSHEYSHLISRRAPETYKII